MKSLGKWSQTIRIWWGNIPPIESIFSFKSSVPFWYFFIKYSLWTEIYKGMAASPKPRSLLGFTLSMLQYHGWILVLSMLTQGNANFDLSADIRLGKISTFLIYLLIFGNITRQVFWLSKLCSGCGFTRSLLVILILSTAPLS